MADAFCTVCHAFIPPATNTSDRHEHQPLLSVRYGTNPKPGTNAARILEVMTDHQGWWSTWDLVPVTGSVHVRDFIRELKGLGWAFDERQDTTPDGKRYKSWKLLLPSDGQKGLF